MKRVASTTGLIAHRAVRSPPHQGRYYLVPHLRNTVQFISRNSTVYFSQQYSMGQYGTVEWDVEWITCPILSHCHLWCFQAVSTSTGPISWGDGLGSVPDDAPAASLGVPEGEIVDGIGPMGPGRHRSYRYCRKRLDIASMHFGTSACSHDRPFSSHDGGSRFRFCPTPTSDGLKSNADRSTCTFFTRGTWV